MSEQNHRLDRKDIEKGRPNNYIYPCNHIFNVNYFIHVLPLTENKFSFCIDSVGFLWIIPEKSWLSAIGVLTCIFIGRIDSILTKQMQVLRHITILAPHLESFC